MLCGTRLVHDGEALGALLREEHGVVFLWRFREYLLMPLFDWIRILTREAASLNHAEVGVRALFLDDVRTCRAHGLRGERPA